jgi:HEPN domain-containing protein
MVNNEIVQEWIIKADNDFDFALINFKEKKDFFPQICFHFHLSAEKYLKAYIIANALEFRKIHDLPNLQKNMSNQRLFV